MSIRNIYACLVHENVECVVDLVCNLRYLDPSSKILLYNGGDISGLLNNFPFQRYDAEIFPSPKKMRWGALHGFALDCMRYTIRYFDYETFTIIDSDQLGLRRNYSDFIGRFLKGKHNIGMLGNEPDVQTLGTKIGPADAALKEMEQWRPFLRRFNDGEKKFVHWTFWPSTVFTAEAVRGLVEIFDTDKDLQQLVRNTRIWATEEVIFPTLVSLLGLSVVKSPCSYEYVKYRTEYTQIQLTSALKTKESYWMHPVPRQYDHPLREYIRNHFEHYYTPTTKTNSVHKSQLDITLLSSREVLAQMKNISGWLEEDEADLLMGCAIRAINEHSDDGAIVEVGSYCGRSTIVLGSVLKSMRANCLVYAIDPHHGTVGAMDTGIESGLPTLEQFKKNIQKAQLSAQVKLIRKYSFEVEWNKPVAMILIDGLHDYVNVARDFYHFEPWLVSGAYVAFHDYADYYPGVQVFVNELLTSGQYRKITCARSLIVLQKLSEPKLNSVIKVPSNNNIKQFHQARSVTLSDIGTRKCIEKQLKLHSDRFKPFPLSVEKTVTSQEKRKEGSGETKPEAQAVAVEVNLQPLVSCVMPTNGRRWFVSKAIAIFQTQDYPNKELIIIDDGNDPVEDLIPKDDKIRYIKLRSLHSTGYKRNLAIELSTGEFIAHWDDDDWYAADRISYQMKPLLTESADICGFKVKYFYDLIKDIFWECSDELHARLFFADLHGRSIVYRKKIFEEGCRFPDLSVSEDAAFLKCAMENNKNILTLDNVNKLIYIRHLSNAWNFDCGTFIDKKSWHIVNTPAFIPSSDMEYYRKYKFIQALNKIL